MEKKFNSEEFKKKLIEAQERLGLEARETKSVSYGSVSDCKNMMFYAILNYDKSITRETLTWLPQYDQVAEWLSDTKGKGLLLTGSCGTGKTLILKFVIPSIMKIAKGNILKPYHAKQSIIEEIGKEMISKKVIAIDDIGSETFLSNYGQRIDVVHDIILSSEELNKTLILTTNLNSEALKERYDERAVDRLRKVCNIIVFPKMKSLRK